MRTDKIRKYVLPNIPYLFIAWACLKLGTAYRLAAGADFPHKLLGLGQTIGPAFADFAPGLHPQDWLIGIVGAVAFRLLIYMKSKNAKKFRRDAEYGSARWGTEKDMKPYTDPVFKNNVILTGTEFLTTNTRPKIPGNARNLNACVIGSSGSGKTRFWLTPQLLQAHSSYVCVDPKGGVLNQVGYFLQKKQGYKIKVFNSIDFPVPERDRQHGGHVRDGGAGAPGVPAGDVRARRAPVGKGIAEHRPGPVYPARREALSHGEYLRPLCSGGRCKKGGAYCKKSKRQKAAPQGVRAGRPSPPSRPSPMCKC